MTEINQVPPSPLEQLRCQGRSEESESSHAQVESHKKQSAKRRHQPTHQHKICHRPGPPKRKEEREQKISGLQKKVSAVQKEDSALECYVKIIEYLKRIEWDEANQINKMNPFNAITPSCFWFMVCANYYSFNFYAHRNPNNLASEYLNKVLYTPLEIPTRVSKVCRNQTSLQFETEEMRALALPISDTLCTIIPNSVHLRNRSIQRSATLTSCAQDDQFRSSTRALVFNQIKANIRSNEKWNQQLAVKLKCASSLKPRQVFHNIVQLIHEQDQSEEEQKHQNLFRRARKVPRQLQQKKYKKKQSQDKIIDEQEEKESNDGNEMIDEEKQASPFEQKESEQFSQKKIDESPNKETVEKQPSKCFSEMRPYTQDDLLLDSILHLPLEKVISILQNQLAEIDLPRIPEQFLSYPRVDLLDFISQTHPQEQKYLEYLKENRPILMERKKRRNQKEKVRKQNEQKQKQQRERQQKQQWEKEVQNAIEAEDAEVKSGISKKNTCMESQVGNKTQCMLAEVESKSEKKSKEETSKVPDRHEEQEAQGKQLQDIKCQICADGDYTDDNLIVFCSTCNISVHQRCVGLSKVPSENWVCQLCAAFGPAGVSVPCPLCNVKGGALKRTSIRIDTPLFRETNPQFHQFAKRCTYNKCKEEYIEPENEPQDLLYYDYFRKSTQDLNLKPQCHYIWCHYTCAVWVPECYFEEKSNAINIKGVETIDKRRFRLQCCICHKSKAGACIKCQEPKCGKFYHPECARKKRVYMEQSYLQKLKYLIFCSEHQPLKLTKEIDQKKKKSRDEIVKFCRMIERYIETYKIAQLPFKLPKNVLPTQAESTRQQQDAETFQTLQRQQRQRAERLANSQKVFKEVVSQLEKSMHFVINIQKVKGFLGSQGEKLRYKVVSVEEPSKREVKKSLTKYNEFWNDLAGAHGPKRSKYSQMMKSTFKLQTTLEGFFGGSSMFGQIMRTQPRRVKQTQQTQQVHLEQNGGIFCICKRPYEGETDMIECQICNEWYHFSCIGFIGGQEMAQGMEFHCMKCMKFQADSQKLPRIQRTKHLFLPDSLFFNYNPPTPELQSEAENQQEQDHRVQTEVNPIVDALQLKQQKHQDQLFQSQEVPQPTQIHYQDQDVNFAPDKPFIIEQGRMSPAIKKTPRQLNFEFVDSYLESNKEVKLEKMEAKKQLTKNNLISTPQSIKQIFIQQQVVVKRQIINSPNLSQQRPQHKKPEQDRPSIKKQILSNGLGQQPKQQQKLFQEVKTTAKKQKLVQQTLFSRFLKPKNQNCQPNAQS